MIIKNYEVEKFGKFLYDLTLKTTPSRIRSRFVKILQSQIDLINEERQQLINEYAVKDDEGNIIYKSDPEDNLEKLKIGNTIEYNEEVFKLMNEDFIIEETESKVEMLSQIKDIVLNCDLELSGNAAMEFDRWCEIVEDIGLN